MDVPTGHNDMGQVPHINPASLTSPRMIPLKVRISHETNGTDSETQAANKGSLNLLI